MGDFLKRGAETPLNGQYLAAGARCRLSTNSASILAAANETFLQVPAPAAAVDFTCRFWVNPEARSEPPWPKPYFRGLDHLIFAGIDNANSFLVDLRSRRVIGTLSPSLAADRRHWKAVLFPNLLTLLGPAIGIAESHCACVEYEGAGVLLWGGTGSGKSTLTFALVRQGFSFLSDDWTYFSRRDGRLRAWGLIPRLKLLPDAADFFPLLRSFETRRSENGEIAYELEPERELGLPRSRSCEPRWLIFLERQAAPEFTLAPMPSAEAAARLEADLWADNGPWLQPQFRIIEHLTQRCWRLRYGGSPDRVAQRLADFCFEQNSAMMNRESESLRPRDGTRLRI